MVVYTLSRCCRASGLFRSSSGLGVLLGTLQEDIFSVLSWLRTLQANSLKKQKGLESQGLQLMPSMSAGILTIYALGVTQLMLVAEIGLGTALALGAIPLFGSNSENRSCSIYRYNL